MNREELDKMWNKAVCESVKDGEMYTRYHFAEAVAAAEREACAKVCEEVTASWTQADYNDEGYALAQAIRARGKK